MEKKAKKEWKTVYRLATQSVVPGAAESASPGSFLEMQNPGPHQIHQIKIRIFADASDVQVHWSSKSPKDDGVPSK